MFERVVDAWKALRGESPVQMALRKWEAARTNRLNQAHWQGATGNSVNADLTTDRETLVKRCMYEAENNPFVAGVIETYVSSVVGADGPTLQVQCDDERYAQGLEAEWREWAKTPEITGQLSLVEILRQNERLFWTSGEWLIQEVEHPDALPGEISYRWNVIHPRRMKNPTMGAMNLRIIDGVERDEIGRPVNYYITDMDTDEYGWLSNNFNSKAFSAGRIIHDFHSLEPGQVRGVPLLSPGLQTAADLRDFDTATLDAARLAADFAVMLITKHPDAKYVAVNEQTDIARRKISTAPPGWEPSSIDPKHPTTNYVEFRKERLRELGRPVNMPLMMVTLDSGEHNYSSARFDGQLYYRGVLCRQSRNNRVLLNRGLARIERQAILNGRIPNRPKECDFVWTWTAPPHVDPQKEAMGWDLMIAIGAASEYDAAASCGRDFETVTAARERARKLLEAAGLPATGTKPMSEADQATNETAKVAAKQKQKATVAA